jgi:AraC-like DNA-binding protein
VKNKRLILEKIKPKEESSSFSWLVNPKLNDFYFWHFHPEYELVYIEAKEGQRHVGDHIGKFHDSDLVLIGSNVPHLNFDFGIKTEYQKTVLHILPNFLGDDNISTPELKSIKILLEKSRFGVCFGLKIKEEIGEKFKKTERKSYFQQFISILEILKVLSETQDFILLNHQASNLSFNKKEENRLRKVYSFIENNYERKIDLGEISEISNLSKAAFCRYFKKMTKLPFTVFLNNYRVNQAKLMLSSNKNVSEACFESGFESLSYFNRTFKKITGQNPSDFRKKNLPNSITT